MACDICLKPSDNLEQLHSIYQTSDIRAICPACLKDANKELDRLRAANAGQLVAYMEQRRGLSPRMRWFEQMMFAWHALLERKGK